MFEPNDTITEMVDHLYRICGPLKRGEYLLHDQIRSALGCDPHTEHWQTCMGKLKRRMRDRRGIVIWNEREVGYKLLTPEEQLTVPGRRQRRANRQVSLGLKDLEALPARELSVHGRRARAAMLAHGQETLRAMRRELRSQQVFLRPTTANPRPRRPMPAEAVANVNPEARA